jgi:hypothetical protein
MAIFGLIKERQMYKHPSLMPLFVSETFKFGWMDEKRAGTGPCTLIQMDAERVKEGGCDVLK